MTRVIAGEWRGHPLPKLKTGSVRPTTDRARTILFDTLRDVRDRVVLDLYSGTGGLGFEALSRGAKSLVSIDKDPRYISAQKEWMQGRDVDFRAFTGDIRSVLKRIDGTYDLILADPPYNESFSSDVVSLIESRAGEDSIFVYESARRSDATFQSDIFKLYKEKVVAETKIQIYKAH